MAAKLHYRSKVKARRPIDIQIDALVLLTVCTSLIYACSYVTFRSIGRDEWNVFLLALLLFAGGSLSACGAGILGVRVVLHSSRGLPLFLLACNAMMLVTALWLLWDWYSLP